MEEACRGVPSERTVGELKLQKSRWLRPHCLKPHRRGFQACLVSFMCSVELHGHSVLVLGHAQRSKGKRLWLVAWIGQTKIKETRQLGHKLQDHKTGASMHEFSFESGDQREAQAGVILKGYSLGTLPGGRASNRGSYCWRYRAWGRRPRAATGRSITRMVGAVVGDAWWLGDSTKNPHSCPERVSFEHPIKSTWHNARSWQCRWHRTASISPNPLPSGEPLWKGQKLQLCNGRARGGGEWRVTNTADHGLYPTVGFRHDPILFSLVGELGVWLLHWTGRFIAGKILLLSHKSVGRTSRPTRDFTQGRGKNQALEEGTKGHGEKASRSSMRPPLPPPLTGCRLLEKAVTSPPPSAPQGPQTMYESRALEPGPLWENFHPGCSWKLERVFPDTWSMRRIRISLLKVSHPFWNVVSPSLTTFPQPLAEFVWSLGKSEPVKLSLFQIQRADVTKFCRSRSYLQNTVMTRFPLSWNFMRPIGIFLGNSAKPLTIIFKSSLRTVGLLETVQIIVSLVFFL